jgi:phosphoribosylglycinamide formyltransferase 1
MRLGVISSSGGSALASAYRCLRHAGRSPQLFLLSDRPCGALDWARSTQIPYAVTAYTTAEEFSRSAANIFRDAKVEVALLFYTRRIAQPLIGTVPIYNIHPSLLPSFPGLRAVRDAIDTGALVLGATLHLVDEGLDTGPIVAQIACGRPHSGSLADAEKISFLQKVYLTLLLCELVQDFGLSRDPTRLSHCAFRDPPHSVNASPSLADRSVMAAFLELENEQGCRITTP